MAAPSVDVRRVRALSARTHFVPGYGQVHFDPDSKKRDVREPLMPVDAIDVLTDRGWIADDLPPEAEPVPAPKRGRKPGTASADQAPAE